ncbi:MAG TPA: HEAT repeat domain-containing protein [Terriglobia bacterium]|nr:HEAT repeat domain-containing protein [Terriglobia bacterium]
MRWRLDTLVDSQLVTRVILFEGFVLAVCVLLIFGHALGVRWYEFHYAPRLSRAQEFVTQLLDSDDALEQVQTCQSAGSLEAVAGLPVRLQTRVLVALARNLSGRQKEAVSALAARTGLTAQVECRLQSVWWWRRLYAARLLTVLGVGESAIPKLLKDRHILVRAQGAEWASRYPKPELMEALLSLLEDSSKLCRFTSQDSLLILGVVAVPYIADYISGQSRPGLEAALEVAVGLAEPRFLQPALNLCDHSAPSVRVLAARLLGRIGGKDAVAALKGLLNDTQGAVRAAAARALGKLGEWPSAPALALFLRDPAWDVRREAGLALRSLGSPGILLLRRYLTDQDRFARDMARQILEIPDSALARAVS